MSGSVVQRLVEARANSLIGKYALGELFDFDASHIPLLLNFKWMFTSNIDIMWIPDSIALPSPFCMTLVSDLS